MAQSDSGILTLWPAGTLLSVSKSSDAHKPNVAVGGGRRNKITAFSRASRRRMLRTFAKLSKTALPVFATLTYPECYSEDPTDWKADLSAWGARLNCA